MSKSELHSLLNHFSAKTNRVFSARHKGRLSGETRRDCEGKSRGTEEESASRCVNTDELLAENLFLAVHL